MYIQIPPRNPRINLDHDTWFMFKHCNKTLFSYYKHTDHAIIYMLVVIFLVYLNTLHSAAPFLQISYSEVTWQDLYLHITTICLPSLYTQYTITERKMSQP